MSTVLWGRPSAYNVMKVECVLRSLNEPFEHRDIGSVPGDLDTPAFKQLNSRSRIPVLQIDGLALRESNSICRYLAERSSDAAWWPESLAERAEINAWLDWELESWQPAFFDLFWGHYRCPPAQHDAHAIEAAASRCEQHLLELSLRLKESAWLGGDTVSIADIGCSIGLHRYTNMDYPVTLPAEITRWLTQLTALPAWRATAMAPFDVLRGRTAY